MRRPNAGVRGCLRRPFPLMRVEIYDRAGEAVNHPERRDRLPSDDVFL